MKILNFVLLTAFVLEPSAFAKAFRSTHLEPVPADPVSLESQLKRFKGQTQFLNSSGSVGRFGDRQMGQQQQQQQQGEDRDVQEADIFKVGKPGSKLLYLLNHYRGLQVVSYAKGAAHPALIGRVEATGNMPEHMYFDAINDQLIVLETIEDYNEDERSYTAVQSRALVYDISQPTTPRLSKVLPIDGEIADSRMVGGILYIASSIRPDWNDVRPLEKSSKGLVYSIELSKNEMKVKERIQLALPASARENMNIVSVKEGAQTKYYLLAMLSESRWGWWSRRSLVEVVDITDANGHIESKMVVSAKGDIREPSQTTIKNNTLIVVSNYQTEGKTPLARIAVETYRLPTAKSEVLTEDEALRRKLNMDHRLQVLSGAERETQLAQSIADSKEGLLGRFIKTAQGLRKTIADSVVTVGDDTGLNASLRDVRFSGDLLYAFWVPANQIDPLDVFDISQPEKGVRYLKRLKFDGWIERSIPVRYGNREFVFGLGYIVPTVNNEDRTRKPQIVLFEIVRNGTDVTAVERAKTVLNKGYANFDNSDKEVELKTAPNGSGSILFQVSFRDGKNWVEGGKMAHFDLSKLEIQEGGFLKANSSWLRRVFTNSEIDRVNTFSDESLATFDSNERIAAGSVTNAISVLELAREIRAYANMNTPSKTFGVRSLPKTVTLTKRRPTFVWLPPIVLTLKNQKPSRVWC